MKNKGVSRRSFIGGAATGLVGAGLGLTGSARAAGLLAPSDDVQTVQRQEFLQSLGECRQWRRTVEDSATGGTEVLRVVD